MNPKEWIDKFSLETKGLYYKLFVIFGMFFLAPVFGFLYFAVKHGILNDEQVTEIPGADQSLWPMLDRSGEQMKGPAGISLCQGKRMLIPTPAHQPNSARGGLGPLTTPVPRAFVG